MPTTPTPPPGVPPGAPSPGAPPPPAVPPQAPPPPAGWELALSEDFDTPAPVGRFALAYPDWSTYDGRTDTSGRGTYATSQVVSVENGILTNALHDGLVAALLPPVDGDPYAGQTQGRYEVRFRVDPVPGYKLTWQLWPASDQQTEGEIDFPEGNLTAGEFTAGSLCVGGTDGDFCYQSNPAPAAPGEWHTAITERTADRLSFYLDGRLIGETRDRAAIPSAPMRWVLQTESEIGGDGPGAEAGNVDIDSVRAWTPPNNGG